MAALTPKQRKLLDFIRAAIEHDGSAPTFDQMARGMGVKSKSDIHRQLKGLEERGAIRRMPNRMRAIEVVEEMSAFAHLVAARDLLERERPQKRMAVEFVGHAISVLRDG